MIKQLQKIETLLAKHEIKTESLAFCEQQKIDVLHIEKRGKRVFHYISQEDFDRLSVDLNKEIEKKEEQRKLNIKAAGNHPNAAQHHFVPTRIMLERLDRIDAKLDLLLSEFGVKPQPQPQQAEASPAPLNGRHE